MEPYTGIKELEKNLLQTTFPQRLKASELCVTGLSASLQLMLPRGVAPYNTKNTQRFKLAFECSNYDSELMRK